MFDRELNEPISEGLFEREDDDFELDLEMNDLLGEYDEEPSGIEVDIFADDRDNCGRSTCPCKAKRTP